MGNDAFTSRVLAIVPAFNEMGSVEGVVKGIRVNLPGTDVLVVDDGSSDDTSARAREAGARVMQPPYNLGIGAAVQCGYMFAAEHDYDLCVQVDADGQHDPTDVPKLLAPLLSGEADLVVGSRFLGDQGYRMPLSRRLGSAMLATTISAITRHRFTDPTSGFRAANWDVIRYCARHYPSDYPEPEALVILHRAGFRILEVPVVMHTRQTGVSSIKLARSLYYMDKVLLAILVGLLRHVPSRSKP